MRFDSKCRTQRSGNAEAPIKRALISVTDKTGMVEFAQTLTKEFKRGISTGGTRKILEEAGVPVFRLSLYRISRDDGSPR